jgi:hypothetical protein
MAWRCMRYSVYIKSVWYKMLYLFIHRISHTTSRHYLITIAWWYNILYQTLFIYTEYLIQRHAIRYFCKQIIFNLPGATCCTHRQQRLTTFFSRNELYIKKIKYGNAHVKNPLYSWNKLHRNNYFPNIIKIKFYVDQLYRHSATFLSTLEIN